MPGNDEIGVAGRRARLLVGEFLVEHARERFGMALRDREDNGLAPIGRAADAVRAGVAVFQNLAKFPYHRAVALRDREFPLERGQDQRSAGRWFANSASSSARVASSRASQSISVAGNRKAVRRRGARRHRAVDLVWHQVPVRDRLGHGVAVGRAVNLEESQRVADRLHGPPRRYPARPA